MRIAEIIGRVTLSRANDMVRGGTWILGVPLSAEGLRGGPEGRGDAVVIYDELGASPGAMIAFSEGGEAAAPFAPNHKPLDAYNAAILDRIHIA